MLFGFRSYGFQILPKYRVFDSDSEGILAKKQMFSKGKLCSTKCNGMLNSLIKRVQSIPGPLAQLSCGATLHLLLKLCTILGSLVLINVSAISLQDLPADDNGTYRHNGMRTWVFEVENDTGGRIKKKMVAKTALKPDQLSRRRNCVTIKRTYHKNKSCQDFVQVITHAEQNGSVVNNLAILHCLFKGEERSFHVTVHGNKKDKGVPFLPVNSTTRQK